MAGAEAIQFADLTCQIGDRLGAGKPTVVEAAGKEEERAIGVENNCLRLDARCEILNLVHHAASQERIFHFASGAATGLRAADSEVDAAAVCIGLAREQQREAESAGKIGHG